MTGAAVEEMYLNVLRDVKRSVHLPVAVKISPYFSSTANMCYRLAAAGANGLVLFNRFYQPDFDLEELEAYPTSELPGFTAALLALIPTLHEHGCSYGTPGGFVRRLEEGTWLGHVLEHVAIEGIVFVAADHRNLGDMIGDLDLNPFFGHGAQAIAATPPGDCLRRVLLPGS